MLSMTGDFGSGPLPVNLDKHLGPSGHQSLQLEGKRVIILDGL